MPKIKILEPELISKIAAGEVVESPASVVKELLENAIDAGSQNIKIDIQNSGFDKITVIDDGVGMDKEDLEKSIMLHATSKIKELDDLWKIGSLGFRGEALASIASVSDFIIKSKTEEADLGYQLEMNEDQEPKLSEVAMNRGTVVSIANLFSRTPARLRFVNSKSYAFRQIVQVVTNLALTFPSISFSLTHNDKEILRFLARETMDARAQSVWGSDLAAHLLPVENKGDYVKIHGYIGRPQIASPSRSRQYIFINNRAVRHPAIARVVKDTFQSLLAPREQPAFMLFLDLPRENLDVNIHPRKEEVKILNQKEILENLSQAVRETLENSDLTYQFNGNGEGRDDYDPHSAYIMKENSKLWMLRDQDYSEAEIIQLHNTYLIAETENGALLIDQHAAHERILFEELKDVYENLEQETVELGEALTFELPGVEADFLLEQLDEFTKLGFIIEEFGKNTFKLTSVPDFFKERDLVKLIKEVLDDLRADKKPLELDYRTERTLAYLACRTAIKAGDYLDMDERRRLLEKLQKTTSNYTCPHGRPSQVEISKKELEGLFGRS